MSQELVIKVSMSQKFRTRIYPECDKARLFCRLTGQGLHPSKTLTQANIDTIKELGYRVEVVPASVPEVTTL